MKILAGQFKNHAIQSNKKFEYRPTTSIARKSIFDTLKSLEGKDFLDLYAGSGIVGFEAASRGAKSVTFIELEKKHMNQIIMNAKEIAYNDFNFMVRDANRFLKKSAIVTFGRYGYGGQGTFCLSRSGEYLKINNP